MRLLPLLCLAAACGGGSARRGAAPAPAAPPSAAARALPPPLATRVNGTVLAYRLFGDSGRTPVVFVHGSLADLGDWNAQVPSFAQAYRVLTYSRRYHRPNPPVDDDETYSPALHADDLAALLLALELPPAHIVGSSYGAYTALVLAQEHPELVRSVVLGEPPIMPLLTGTEEGDAIRRAYFANTLDPARAAFSRGDSVAALRAYYDGVAGGRVFDNLPLETRSRLVAHAFEMRREMLANREQYLPQVPCRELERLRTPVLLLSAERSTRLFHVITAELGRCLQSDTTVVIPGATHVMHRTNPRYYNQVVLRFLVDH
jgi:pimeloyl-ACP methyl ester carboxylesterase